MSGYIEKHALFAPQIIAPPKSGTFNIIVIPCYDEPSIEHTLTSLMGCTPPELGVEVIVVVNSSAIDASSVLSQNEKSIATIKQFNNNHIPIHVMHQPDLPVKHAGVGLARKIGMDEAVHRFLYLSSVEDKKVDGVVTCLDADCTVSKEYMIQIEQFFLSNKRSPAASIRYWHEIENVETNTNKIIDYELHLRYYNQGLKFAGLPYAYHTVGSAMVVRYEAYQKQGGMNKRKAGEDFYFLHKFMPLSGFGHIDTAIVYPSSRDSTRVPFGTGRAMLQMDKEDSFVTYPLAGFIDVKSLVALIPDIYNSSDDGTQGVHSLSKVMKQYLNDKTSYNLDWKNIKDNTASLEAFEKRFYHWMNAFWVMKFLNYYRETMGGAEVGDSANSLLMEMKGYLHNSPNSKKDLLLAFRKLSHE